jgi:CHAT domain-containing protein
MQPDVQSRIILQRTEHRARPVIAPGAVVIRQSGGHQFVALSETGAPAGTPKTLSLDHASPGGMAPWRDGYLLVGGFSELVLFDLARDGSERRRLILDHADVLHEAVLAVNRSHCLVAWSKQDTSSVFAAWVELDRWIKLAAFRVNRRGTRAQHPCVLLNSDAGWIAWSESVTGPLHSVVGRVAPGKRVAGRRTVPLDKGPAYPVCFISGCETPAFCVLQSGSVSVWLLNQPAVRRVLTYTPEVVFLMEGMPEYAAATLEKEAALIFKQESQLVLGRISYDGELLERRSIGPDASRTRSPAIAAEPKRLWLAWEQFDAEGPLLAVTTEELHATRTPNGDSDDPLYNLRRHEVTAMNDTLLDALDRHDFKVALEIAQKLLALCQRWFPNTRWTAGANNNLGEAYRGLARYEEAEASYLAAAKLHERIAGSASPDLAVNLANLAEVCRSTGRLNDALTHSERSAAILQGSYEPDDPRLATAYNNLGDIHKALGNYTAAEGLLCRALDLHAKAGTVGSVSLAKTLKNLGDVLSFKGSFADAQSAFEQAAALFRESLGSDHPLLAYALQGLAMTRARRTIYENAETRRQVYDQAIAEGREALRILTTIHSLDHPAVMTTCGNLATLLFWAGKVTEARELTERSLDTLTAVLGPNHPETANLTSNLALFLEMEGDLGRASQFFERALHAHESALGPSSQGVATVLSNWSGLKMRVGKPEEALSLRARAADIEEERLAAILTFGSEQEKLDYSQTLGGQQAWSIALQAQWLPRNEEALRLAFTTVLRRKGRVLDALRWNARPLRLASVFPIVRELAGQIKSLREELARLENESDPSQERARRLRTDLADAERNLAAASNRLAGQPAAVTLDAVQGAIPLGGVLVEWVLHCPLNLSASIAVDDLWDLEHPRYLAYLLYRDGPPVWVDVGPARPIWDAIAAFRKSVTTQGMQAVRTAARRLDELVMAPLRPLASSTLIIAPEGELNFVPFGALIDLDGRFLAETHSVAYVTSGRDLVDSHRVEATSSAAVFANPDFGRSGENNRGGERFAPLPNTEIEGLEIAHLWPDAQLFIGSNASKQQLLETRRPRVLHIASHGFYWHGPHERFAHQSPATLDPSTAGPAPNLPTRSGHQHRMLNSGIALAGANRGPDGIVTALELSGLDLEGTQVVVLSGCDTGVGDPVFGHGVYGLRRALALAGSRNQLLSLWKIDDEATCDFMIAFHRELLAGTSALEALRRIQLSLLGREDRKHPFWWAPFVLSLVGPL